MKELIEEQIGRKLFEHSTIGICCVDFKGRVLECNPSIQRITGYSLKELRTMTFADITHPDDVDMNMKLFVELLDGIRDHYKMEKRYIRKDGTVVWGNLTVILARNPNGEPLHVIAMVEDITERKEAEAQIRYLAYHDTLTGLPNRRCFMERIEKAVRSAAQTGEKVGLLFIDLNHFKNINDSLGHAAGDLLLTEVAHRLSRCMEEKDTAARMAGDEFTLLLQQVKSRKEVEQAANHVRNALKPPFILEGHAVTITASIGMALYPEDGEDTEELLRCADKAMYASKEQG